jgi:penicillin-binding protein 1A
MLKKQFLPTWPTLKIFNQSKDNKTLLCQHSSVKHKKFLNQAMKSSNRWAVMKSDKSEEEIIKSFSEKNKMTVFSWKGEKIPS